MSKVSLWVEYKVYCDLLFVKEPVPANKWLSRSTFYRIWSENYSYVTVPKHAAFSVCITCAQLHDRILSASKSEYRRDLLEKLQILRRKHLDFVGQSRLQYRVDQDLAREKPEENVSICIDGMDQAKLRSPHFAGGGIPKGTWYIIYLSNVLFLKFKVLNILNMF